MGAEVFMHCIRLGLGAVPLNEWLATTLGVGQPNAVHAVLARALDEGHRIWSFNIDELIERAPAPGEDQEKAMIRRGEWVAHRARHFRPDEPTPLPAARLLKPHGSLSLGNFLFRTDQVLYPLPPTWAARLRADCGAADVVVIGYRGADIDMRAALNEALGRAASIRWFVRTRQEWDEMTSFLPALQGLDPVPPSDNPSQEFVDWAATVNLDGYVTDEQRALVGQWSDPCVPEPSGSGRLARAYLLERLNEPADAAAAFRAEVFAPGIGHRRRKAAVKYLKLQWYQQGHQAQPHGAIPVAFRAIRGLDRRLPRHRLPPPVGRRLRRAHIMLLSSVYGEHDAALTLACGADEHDPATWIVRAKALRNRGLCDQALAAAHNASQCAVPSGGKVRSRPDEATHAMFERTFALIWLGRWAEAEQELSILYGGYDGQAAARWLGWSRYLRGGLSLLQGHPADARRELADASVYFASDDEGRRRALACDVLMRAVARSEGRPDTSEVTLPPIGLAVIRQLRMSADIEVAEAARSTGDLDLARRKYEPLSRLEARPMVSVAALIGLAEASVATGHPDAAAASKAERLARQSGFRHLEAAAIIASCRTGQRHASDGLRLLGSFQDVLKGIGPDPGWLQRVVTDPHEHHPVYCLW
jgi:SIR2-like domain